VTIKRNTLYNVAGATVPLAITLVTVPLYLQVIGQARFGMLAIVWLLLGYLGMLDLGLSTASTHALARARSDEPAVRARIVLTSLVANLGLGLFIAAVLLLGGPWLISKGSFPPGMGHELQLAMPWLCAAIPIAMAGGVLNGLLTAREEFGRLNLVNLAGTALFQLVPLGAAFAIGPQLNSILPAAVLARAVPVAVLFVMSRSRVDYGLAGFESSVLKQLVSYGGWVMVTSLVGPVLVSADQLMIGAIMGAAAVAPYNVASNLAVRVAVLPSALGQTLFPRLSGLPEAEATELAGNSFRTLSIVVAIACVPAILLVRPFFTWWLGAHFAASSAPVAQFLLVAVWINSLAGLPFTLVRARGRPEIAARFHLLEVVPFLILLYVLIGSFGLMGAAAAWLLRVLADAVLLIRASRLPSSSYSLLPLSAVMVGIAALVAATLSLTLVEAILLALVSFIALGLVARALDPVVRSTSDSILAFIRLRTA
jgi:O-antigen/teichoic acid export membrane protein